MINPLTKNALLTWLRKQSKRKMFQFSSCQHCMIAQFLHTKAKDETSVTVGGFTFNMDGQLFNIPEELQIGQKVESSFSVAQALKVLNP